MGGPGEVLGGAFTRQIKGTSFLLFLPPFLRSLPVNSPGAKEEKGGREDSFRRTE